MRRLSRASRRPSVTHSTMRLRRCGRLHIRRTTQSFCNGSKLLTLPAIGLTRRSPRRTIAKRSQLRRAAGGPMSSISSSLSSSLAGEEMTSGSQIPLGTARRRFSHDTTSCCICQPLFVKKCTFFLFFFATPEIKKRPPDRSRGHLGEGDGR